VVSTTGTLASTLGLHNPFRYRGYYYDVESELYYLNSRYYDPEIKRFINAEGIVDPSNMGNLYAYCNNNPVICIDPSGNALEINDALRFLRFISNPAEYVAGELTKGVQNGIIASNPYRNQNSQNQTFEIDYTVINVNINLPSGTNSTDNMDAIKRYAIKKGMSKLVKKAFTKAVAKSAGIVGRGIGLPVYVASCYGIVAFDYLQDHRGREIFSVQYFEDVFDELTFKRLREFLLGG